MYRKYRIAAGFVLVAALIGCGGTNMVPAKISGNISYKGKPIKGGQMFFVTTDGQSYPATISSDGTYQCNDLPIGEMIITVSTESVSGTKADPGANTTQGKMYMKLQTQRPGPSGGGGGGTPPPKEDLYVKIPEKYKNAKTSPITHVLVKGRQLKDFDLTD